MKKLVVILVILFAAVAPLTAMTNVLNVGYFQFSDFEELNFHRRSLGLQYTFLSEESGGFYFQFAPYITVSTKTEGFEPYKYFKNDRFGGGFGTTLGFGMDVELTEEAGAIVGGGLYIDGYAHKTQGFDWIYYNAKFGIIGGAKMYSILAGDRDSGGMGVNIGLDLAYHPFYLYGYTDTGFEEFNFRPWIFTGMITVGVSFH